MGPLAVMGIQAGLGVVGGLLGKALRPKFNPPAVRDETPAVLAASQIGREQLLDQQGEIVDRVMRSSAGTSGNIAALQSTFRAGNQASRALDNQIAVMLRDAARDRIRRQFDVDMMKAQMNFQQDSNLAAGVLDTFGNMSSAGIDLYGEWKANKAATAA